MIISIIAAGYPKAVKKTILNDTLKFTEISVITLKRDKWKLKLKS